MCQCRCAVQQDDSLLHHITPIPTHNHTLPQLHPAAAGEHGGDRQPGPAAHRAIQLRHDIHPGNQSGHQNPHYVDPVTAGARAAVRQAVQRGALLRPPLLQEEAGAGAAASLQLK